MKNTIIAFVLFSFLAIDTNAQTNKNNSETQTMSPQTTERMSDENTDAKSFNEYKEVEKALQPYIVSAGTGDGKLSRSAFYDHAHIVGSVAGEFYTTTADDFGKVVTAGGASENIQSHITWIDISGPAAAAKVEFIDWGGQRFTDFFVLYKKDGVWKISGKVYDSHSNN